MQERIKQILKNLPDYPGVYLMKDGEGQIIYVGKAVSLKNRVRQYFINSRSKSPKERTMVDKIRDIDYIRAASETEALMLECNLIKQHRPKYNILLKDDKNFPYIRVDLRQDFPRVEVVRRVRSDGAKYLGPYLAAHVLREALDIVNQSFGLRFCKKDIPRAIERGERPCLNYQIGRCVAPCSGRISREEYHEAVRRALDFLSGRHGELLKELRVSMEKAAQALDFERAAVIRDSIEVIERLSERQQRATSTSLEDRDVFALLREEATIVQGVFVREGKVVGSESYQMQEAEDEPDENVMESFLLQFYENAAIPREIIVAQFTEEMQVLQDYLSEKRGSKVVVFSPKRGEKRRLLQMAQQNAEQSMERLRQRKRWEWERQEGAIRRLQEELSLPVLPRRIEAYDISNIQGVDSVGSMVVFVDGKPSKKDYRHFRIKTVEGPDDFASMHEVVLRRFNRGQEEIRERREQGLPLEQGRFSAMPDLVVIDGGKGQLGAALSAMQEAGVDCPIFGLAKKQEEIFFPDATEPVLLKRGSAPLHLIQRLRDEAHRFAITHHRALRSKRLVGSELDRIFGIGKKRKTALLRNFLSLEQIKNASLEELRQVEGMNASSAQAVFDYFRDRKGEKDGRV
ncbi:MAG: excinuclease ABC subunit UvrC [Christensenellales bacterium]